MTLHILSTGPHKELLREQDGEERWCFQCRKRRRFDYVISAPDFEMPDDPADLPTAAYYGPSHRIECSHCHLLDGDMFPGRYRVWGGDE